ncbi:hypothetical protein CCY01nite_24440 [Chitinophaga cymbidii]|uniref:Uncharacterized protein n=2 Tax=Chitinophaga cymbidii TaxID=1096750 RepID=A0A512RKG2_9BACT|nr:hypothetical protein CCY01nite_24440 [Chitinophaga cymbidii]
MLLFAPAAFAQGQPGSKKAEGPVISLGGGIAQTTSTYLKDSAFFGNGPRLTGNVFIPVFKPAPALSLGLDVAGSYTWLKADNSLSFVQKNYRLTEGAISPSAPEGVKNSRAFSFSAGPQLQWSAGRFFISPGIRLGYTNVSRGGFSIGDSITPSSAFDRKRYITFFSVDETAAGGLTVAPQLKAGLRIGRHLSLWAGAEYVSGPAITTTSTYWQPLGEPVDGAYNYGQYVEGKAITRSVESKLSSFGLQGGIAFHLPGGKTRDGGVEKPLLQSTEQQPVPSQQKDPQRKQTATAPVILSPDRHMTASLHNGHLFFHYIPSDFPQSGMKLIIWKIQEGRRIKVLEDTWLNGWNGAVKGEQLKADKSGVSRYEAQLTAFYHPAAGIKSTNKSIFLAASVPVYENNGNSNIAAFNIQNNCTVDHAFSLDSTKCIGGDTIRVYGHANILPNSAGVTSAIITFDPVFLETTTNTQVTPVNIQPANPFTVTTNSTSFSFDVVGDMCNKQLRVFYDFSYQCPTLSVPAHIPCADTISLPCCICTYCDDPANMNIVTGAQSFTLVNTGEAAISQQFTVTPKNITKVTAQIVYIGESNIDPACRDCAKDESAVYHFTGSNQAQWNGGGQINGAPSPAKIIQWDCNNQGDLALNMHIALPGLAQLDCCRRDIRICIRYTFTDKDCKTCERLVCYEGTQIPKH